MSLFEDWKKRCEDSQVSQETYAEFWKVYFAKETEGYKKVLAKYPDIIGGKLSEVASELKLDTVEMLGYLDGANQSFSAGSKDLESLTEDSDIKLDFDFEKLYFNMHECKAEWLYTLPEWNTVLSEEKRSEITKQYRASKIFVRGEKIGRNDPCPCGSGKKYKNCCGKNL